MTQLRFFCVTALVLACTITRAQQKLSVPSTEGVYYYKKHFSLKDIISADSLGNLKSPVDSVQRFSNRALDSVQKVFHHGTDSLQKAYSVSVNKTQGEINRLNHKKDSLTKLNLPTTPLVRKIDSLENAQKQKLNELNTEVGKMQSKALSGISSLHLPPEAQNEISSLTKNINGFSLPGNLSQFSLNGLKIPGVSISSLGLPGSLTSGTGIPSLQNMGPLKTPVSPMTQPTGQTGLPAVQAGSYTKQLQSASGMASEAGIEKEATNLAGQNSEMKNFLQEETQLKGMGKQLSQLKDTKKLDSAALQQLKPAVNHFLGKEKELQAAMGKVSQLKQKYSNVTSMKELPKRAPNPLKGKPWYERTIMGLGYFVQSKSYTLVDLNPYLGWRFNRHISATIGWNQRMGISNGNLHTDRYDRVYGVRTSISYLWTRGITFKIAPEAMRAYIPTDLTRDTKHQAWVWGIYAGIRKDFPVYKSLKGYSEVMYNFDQKPFENLYGDRVVFRFGFEMSFKKVSPQHKKKSVS